MPENVSPPRGRVSTLADRVAARRAVLTAALERFLEIARRHSDVESIYVFGSYARGDVRPHSDLDLLVVRDTALRRIDRDRDLRLEFDVPIGFDLIVVTPSEFERDLRKTGIGTTIVAEAKRVYAR